MEASNAKAMREALERIAIRSAASRDFDPVAEIDYIHDIAESALAAPPRVCDVNTLESLTDFVEKTILTSDLLKDAHGIAKSIAVASVRTALTIAYEPAALKNAASEIRDECNRQEQGENNGSK